MERNNPISKRHHSVGALCATLCTLWQSSPVPEGREAVFLKTIRNYKIGENAVPFPTEETKVKEVKEVIFL